MSKREILPCTYEVAEPLSGREGSRVPVLRDDRGEVAKAFDVGIFSNFCNLEGF